MKPELIAREENSGSLSNDSSWNNPDVTPQKKSTNESNKQDQQKRAGSCAHEPLIKFEIKATNKVSDATVSTV